MTGSRVIVLICAGLLGACASIFEGTTQQITVNTTPTGARCTFWKSGTLVADIASTPGAATIDKSREDLFIVCDKPGYATATFVNRSGLAMVTWANILTAGLAWAVDSSRGADNKYQGDVTLALAPMANPVPIAPARAVPTPTPAAPEPPQATIPARAGIAPPPAIPPSPPSQLDCAAADGSRIRVTGSACPAGWTPAQ